VCDLEIKPDYDKAINNRKLALEKYKEAGHTI